MNNKNYKLIWLTLILSAIFISCKKTDTTIGSKLQDDEGVFSHYTLTNFNISAGTIIKNDSIIGASNLNLAYVGKSTDAVSGTIEAEIYAQVGLGGDEPSFGDNPVCDSIKIRLSLSATTTTSRVIEGNGTASNTVSVHLLEEYIADDSLAKNSKQYNTDVLGSTVYTASTIEDGYITITLANSLGDDLMALADGVTADNFLYTFDGIAIVGADDDEAVVAYNLNSSDTYIVMYYHNDDNTNKEYSFDLSTDLDHHTYVSTDYSGSNFSSISSTLTDNSSTSNQTLIQNGSGASTLITIEDFISQIDTTKDIVVNRAILYLPIVPTTYEEQFYEEVSYVRIFETDAQGENLGDSIEIVYPDLSNISDNTSYIFFYNEDENAYELDLTYYFQEYLLGNRSLHSLLISPNISNSIFGVNRSVIDADNIGLKLYYSDL